MDFACIQVPWFAIAVARRENPQLAGRPVVVGGAPEEHAEVTACSPEATRSRGGGPGADIGNRGAAVELHGAPPTTMFYRTPAEGLAAPMGGMVVAP